MTSHVNSQVLGVLDPHQVSSVMKSTHSFASGYPVPGPQSLSVTDAMNKDCFVDNNTWRLIAENGEFDDIVVGSGFCALGYIDEALRLDPFRKILLLERGGFWLPDHFQNLPLPFQFVSHDVSETFPWELTSETAEKKIYLNGSSPFFGGRSSFWSIWSPRAIGERAPTNTDLVNNEREKTRDEFNLMNGFPKFMKEIAKEPDFYKDAERLLHVKPANKIEDPVYNAVLQKQFDRYLRTALQANTIPGALYAEPARLATGVSIGLPTQGFRQFSTVGSLLSINEWQNKLARQHPPAGKPIMIATDVVVERFEVEGPAGNPTHARVLHTSRGPLTLRSGKTNVILATGAIPATTILLNSLDQTFKNRPTQDPAGKRLTSHFRSTIKARFRPGPNWVQPPNPADELLDVAVNLNENEAAALPNRPVISASHVRGRDGDTGNLQWHIQMHGSYLPEGYQERGLSIDEKAQLYSRLFTSLAPDNGDTLTPEQAKDSDGYILVSCSVLGEHPKETTSRVELNKNNPDVTTNIRLHLDLHPTSPPERKDSVMKLWKTMEDSTLHAIEAIAANQLQPDTAVEYWNREDRKWEPRVGTAHRERYIHQVKSLFHEASTTFMAEDFNTERDVEGAEKDDIKGASVNKNYRPRGLDSEKGNVYVTGAGLFPTAGSWNPTPTIVGFAQHLAKTLAVPSKRVGVITQDQLVPTTKTLGRPYIVGFKADGSVSFWSFSGQPLIPPSNRPGTHHYTNSKHVRLLADTTGTGFYDLVVFGDTGVHIATRNRANNEDKFNNFVTVPVLEGFTYNAGWRVDKHIRYMADVRKTGRADIIGFGDAGVFLSKNEPEPGRFTLPSIVLHDLCYDKGWRLDRHLRVLADFYGQGLPDIIGFGETSVVIAKNNGNGTFEGPHDVQGLTEFTYSSGWRVNKHVRTLAHVTSKERVDIIGFGDKGVYLAINKGNGNVGPAQLVLKDFGYSNKGKWRVEKHLRMVVDVDGDGFGDIVAFGENGVYVSKNRGNGRFEGARLVSRDFGYEQGWRIEKHLRFMVDVTGNGCADIIGFKDDKAYVAFNDGQGNFGHAQSLDSDPEAAWIKGWDPSTTVGYVTRLGHKKYT